MTATCKFENAAVFVVRNILLVQFDKHKPIC